MYGEIFPSLEKWFNNYVNKFQFSNENDQKQINLKYKHSYNVSKIIEELAKSIKLKEEEIYIAKIIGLFHDIGRFVQYANYKTFSDQDSIDHGKLGVKILEQKGVLVGLQQNAQEIIVKSIYYHNKPELPWKEQSNTLRFCRLIRDADKLDIFSIFVNRYKDKKDNKIAGQHLERKPGISPFVFNQLMAGEVINYNDLKTLDDLKLMQLGWVYDINYKKSFEILKEQEYLESIYKSMVQSRESLTFYKKVKDYLKDKLTAEHIISL